MTIHKITAGDGYTYLTRQVAAGDSSPERGKSAAEYYTETGNPPGVWMGRGLEALGVSGRVSEEQMTALFGLGLHPNAEAIMADYQREHVVAGMTDRQLKKVTDQARKAAALGRPYPEYKDLLPFDERVAGRLESIRRETGREPTGAEEKQAKREEARRQRRAVAGFDLVFTPVSSVSRLWGLDPRSWVREAIEQAHYAARDAALKLLGEHAAHTRTGSSGQAQIETHGLVAAVFDHADNRLGEPNLHSHVAVSGKVLGVDGKWRALDARGLYRITVAASELYNTRLEVELHARLGLEFEERPDTAGKREPVREIKGFPSRILAHFTRRRSEIELEYQRLVTEFRAAHGRDPSLAAAHELAQQATLATRKGKKPPRAWSAMRAEWSAELAEAFGSAAVGEVMSVVPERGSVAPDVIASGDLELEEIAARVVSEVQEHHATWTRWSVLAQAERELRGTRFMSPAEHERTVDLVVAKALSRWSLSTEPPELVAEPAALRRADGSSVFTQHGAERYTSQEILDAEARLVDASNFATTVGIDGQTAAVVLAAHYQRGGQSLDPGQRALVNAFACDGRLLLAGIGPAGAGKTTAMKALAEVVTAGGTGRLVPLATSASAAGVLAKDLGAPAENLHKFLWEWTKGPHAKALAEGRKVPSGMEFFALGPGDVVLVDEAGMAGTLNLDRLVKIAAQHGAVVRVLGDYRQLGAVESGGALRLIAQESGAVELTTLYRFASPIEAEATLKIRIGDTAGLDFYEEAGRVLHGSRQSMTEQAYVGWKQDMASGRTSLMVAATNADVSELCARARADRVAAGQVEADGVRLHDGNAAGVGDWIVTRDNNRRLRAGARDFVKNGDGWKVLERHEDGALLVEHFDHHGRVLLPAEYVAANVELLYATTAHRAQGSTVDTVHTLVTAEMGRENFYVIVSRAHRGAVLYVATHELASLDVDEHVDAVPFDVDAYAAREILEQVVGRETAELSATEQIRNNYAEAESLASLVPRYNHALDTATDSHYRRMVERVLPDLAAEITADPAWHAVLRALREAEAAGWDAASLLAATTRRRELGTAESLAQVISWRLHRVIDHERPAADPAPSPADVHRYRDLLAELAPALADEIGLESVAEMPAPRTSAGPDREREYVRALHRTLGTVRVNHARNESTWNVLLLALRRADDLGHDPSDILNAAVDRRTIRTSTSLSQAVALAIHRRLDAGVGSASNNEDTAWPRVVRLLSTLERAGADLAMALSEALGVIDDGPDASTLANLAAQLNLAAQHLNGQLPAWLRTTHAVENPEWRSYLEDRAGLIRHRVDALGEVAATERPAWTSQFGHEPADPIERETWLRHLATIAAYRDEYQVTDNDPEHPLGPYPARGRVGHRAYWIAAASLLALRGTPTDSDLSRGRLAADCYRTLPAGEQARIATELAEQLGPDWLGDTIDPATDADQPVHLQQLAVVLAAHGHLDELGTRSPDQNAIRRPRTAARSRQRQERRGQATQPSQQQGSDLPRIDSPRRVPTTRVFRPPQNPPDQPRGPRPGQ